METRIADAVAALRAWQRGTVVWSWLVESMGATAPADSDFGRLTDYPAGSGSLNPETQPEWLTREA